MKHILIDLDDRTARELERVAPAKKRQRAEFLRLAIRRARDRSHSLARGALAYAGVGSSKGESAACPRGATSR